MNSTGNEIAYAASMIRAGELVVFPTETVYGLGADALDHSAVAKVFAAKGRPADNPLIVHLAGPEDLPLVAEPAGDIAAQLLEAFSPGPLTVVLPVGASLPRIVTAGLDTVAVRIPSHPVAQQLLRECERPIAAPSANRSGEPSPTTMAMARRSLGDLPAAYLDGGRCDVGLESTVVSVGEAITILRPGAVSRSDLEGVIPHIEIRSAGTDGASPAASPGVRHRHYQPQAAVVLFDDLGALEAWIARSAATIAVICSAQTAREPGLRGHRICTYSDEREYARYLYSWFHELDDAGVQVVAAQYPPAGGLGDALRDRLERSSGGRFVEDEQQDTDG